MQLAVKGKAHIAHILIVQRAAQSLTIRGTTGRHLVDASIRSSGSGKERGPIPRKPVPERHEIL
jgi:hypothetical protein